jgi:hypothetical protein
MPVTGSAGGHGGNPRVGVSTGSADQTQLNQVIPNAIKNIYNPTYLLDSPIEILDTPGVEVMITIFRFSPIFCEKWRLS